MSDDLLLSEEKPGIFERWGISYFQKLAANAQSGGTGYDRLAHSDDAMVWRVRKVTFFGCAVAFIIGGISAGGSVLADVLTEDLGDLRHYGSVALVTGVLTLIEFAVLFIVSIRTVFSIARITGHDRLEMRAASQAMIPNLLSRAALEIPDPVRRVFGIDPLARVSKKKMLMVGLLYKVKVVLSNVLAKLVMKRVLARSGLRIIVPWVSVPISGLWNAVVTIKVAREARLRLFGNLLAEYLAVEMLTESNLKKLSPEARMGCLQAVGNSVVLTQNYHPNMLILLVRIASVLNIKEGRGFEDWNLFLETLNRVPEHERNFILDLLAVATAFDGKLSRLERKMLPQAFGVHTDAYMKRVRDLKGHLHAGRLNAAKALCVLDFEAG